jgi:hypothetical protein
MLSVEPERDRVCSTHADGIVFSNGHKKKPMIGKRRLRIKEAMLSNPEVCAECTSLYSRVRGRGARDL